MNMPKVKSCDRSFATETCKPCYQTLSEAKREQFIPLYCLRNKQPYRSVLMAVASHGELINQQFEQSQAFLIYETTCHEVKFVGRCCVKSCENCTNEEQAVDEVINALEGCEVVLCTAIGHKARVALESAKIQANNKHPLERVEDALRSVYQTMLMTGKLGQESSLAY
ncbi:NifB/NifX family molybdenum-iron cluster-binding protein [Beggiatoa leptomitoformis]|nr:NifB/NifX family molybdenum-iron cluster-binding protein [Beggiatoa leptomitoformis]